MANIALVVASVSHATTQINIDLLVGAGHSVVTLEQAGVTYADLTEGNYDIICALRCENIASYSAILRDAWATGIPLICGSIGGQANTEWADGVGTLVGLTGSVATANDASSIIATHEDPIFNELAIAPPQTLQVYSADHYMYRAEKISPNYSIAETEVPVADINQPQTAFAIGMKGQPSALGDNFPSNIAWLGFFYGASGYTPIGADIILKTIEQLIEVGFFISGTVTDENAMAGAFNIRAYNALSGRLYSSTFSHSETGNYSVYSRYSTLNLMCVHNADQVTNKPLAAYVNENATLDFSFASDAPDDTPPTSYNLVVGNVKKLALPFEAQVVATSLGLSPKVLASTVSDPETGEYVLDVYPHEKEVLLYVTPDYGVDFEILLPMSVGSIVHPSTPNKYVYVAKNSGELGADEPNWPTQGEFNSGTVTLRPVPLYRPLANGFVKPNIVAI
jgi:hypothetical protein